MLNDRGVLTGIRESLDSVFGRELTHTLVFWLPAALKTKQAHFEDALTFEQKRRLFAASVNFIEVETHSYCNRRCWFCPNAFVDRRSTRHYLPEAVFQRILTDLKTIDYRRRFYFSHYNEPFGDDIIFERIAQTRLALPRAHLRVHSNGDFLTLEKIERACRLGMNELQVGVYLPNHARWTHDAAERFLQRIIRRLRLRPVRRREVWGQKITYECGRNGERIVVFCPNYEQDGVCRGGTINGVPVRPRSRVSPCMYAVTDLYVEYNGHVMPCCNLRSDIEAQRRYSFGKIDDTPGSIFNVWGSAVAARWRKAMSRFGPKGGPCRTCQAREWADTPLARAVLRMALRSRRRPSESRRMSRAASPEP